VHHADEHSPRSTDAFVAIVLAGGRAERLGGVDKTALMRGGRTLLRESVDASSEAERIVVVGAGNRSDGLSAAHRPLARRAVFVDEEPAHGGPVPGIAAGLRTAMPALGAHGAGSPAWTLLLSADLPHAVAAVRRLLGLRLTTTSDALIGVDSGGRRQPLLALYRTPRLLAALDAVAGRRGLVGAPLHEVVRALDPGRIRLVGLPDGLCNDIDTWEDVAAAGYSPATAAANGRMLNAR
jgi:molybdopterin-guanine dinucleotide biosynthesis protein A